MPSSLKIFFFKFSEIFFVSSTYVIRSFIKRQASGTLSDSEWQRMTMSDNELYNEWQRVVQRVTASDSKR